MDCTSGTCFVPACIHNLNLNLKILYARANESRNSDPIRCADSTVFAKRKEYQYLFDDIHQKTQCVLSIRYDVDPTYAVFNHTYAVFVYTRTRTRFEIVRIRFAQNIGNQIWLLRDIIQLPVLLWSWCNDVNMSGCDRQLWVEAPQMLLQR